MKKNTKYFAGIAFVLLLVIIVAVIAHRRSEDSEPGINETIELVEDEINMFEAVEEDFGDEEFEALLEDNFSNEKSETLAEDDLEIMEEGEKNNEQISNGVQQDVSESVNSEIDSAIDDIFADVASLDVEGDFDEFEDF